MGFSSVNAIIYREEVCVETERVSGEADGVFILVDLLGPSLCRGSFLGSASSQMTLPELKRAQTTGVEGEGM